MEKYPLKIMLTNALTDSIGIANPRNSVAPAILVIEFQSPKIGSVVSNFKMQEIIIDVAS